MADREPLSTAYAETQDAQAIATYTIVVTIVTYTAISVINALAPSTTMRRREFGPQRLTGLTRDQVLRMLAERAWWSQASVLLGTVVAFAAIVPVSIGRAGSLTLPASPLIYAGIVAGTLVLALLAIVVLGWQATRRRPIDVAVAP